MQKFDLPDKTIKYRGINFVFQWLWCYCQSTMHHQAHRLLD